MIYRTDYHVHTYFSDGDAWPEDYIGRAIEIGLDEIGFSDHLTLTQEQQDWSIKLSDLDNYVNRILKLKDSTDAIKVKLGLEVDYFPGKEKLIYETITGLPLDYIIGSVHYMGDETVDLGPEFYENKDINLLFESYFQLVGRAAATNLFDFMAHPDLVRIFGHSPVADAEIMYRRLARELYKAGVAFEINTNGINKDLGDFYPDRRYLSVFLEEGVPVLVNSDAHNPANLGQYFNDAYSLLINTGYTEMMTYNKRTGIPRILKNEYSGQ